MISLKNNDVFWPGNWIKMNKTVFPILIQYYSEQYVKFKPLK